VTDVRTGRRTCYDRMVIDVPGVGRSHLGCSVRYVKRLYRDGSGRLVPVGGGAVLEVRVTAPAYDPDTEAPACPAKAGRPLPNVNCAGYRIFRDARERTALVGSGLRLGAAALLEQAVAGRAENVVPGSGGPCGTIGTIGTMPHPKAMNLRFPDPAQRAAIEAAARQEGVSLQEYILSAAYARATAVEGRFLDAFRASMAHSGDAFTEGAGTVASVAEQRAAELQARHGLEEQRNQDHAA
jgi:hypothetical protein